MQTYTKVLANYGSVYNYMYQYIIPENEKVLKRIERVTYECGFTCLAHWNSRKWILTSAKIKRNLFWRIHRNYMANLWWRSHHVKFKVYLANPLRSIGIRGYMKKVVRVVLWRAWILSFEFIFTPFNIFR